MLKLEIKNLRKEGYSYREISTKLDASYGYVKRTCFGVEMSTSGFERHSRLNGNIRLIDFEKELSDTKVRIMSNLLFDGAVYSVNYNYTMMYVNSTDDLVNQFVQDMEGVYRTKPSAFEIAPNYKRVKYYSKQIYQDLMQYFKSYSTSSEDCFFPNDIMSGPDSYKIIILRAFWENEGSISAEGKLAADLKSFKVIHQLSKLHDEFGLKHKICQYSHHGQMYKLYLSKNKENYQRFIDLKLFDRANVTRGYFKGMKKIKVLMIIMTMYDYN